MRDNHDRHILDTTATFTVLCANGIANHIDNWFKLLRRSKTLIENYGDLLDNLTEGIDDNFDREVSIYCVLFSLGISAVTTVARLERIIDELSTIEPAERELWIGPLESNDYYTIVNHPWVIEERRDDLDADDAADRYRRMSAAARNSGMKDFAIHCAIAQAVMLYEYRNDRERALSVFDHEGAYWGNDLALDRARARFYSHYGERREEFSIYERIADVRTSSSDVEQANRLRDAAISAASLQKWRQAEKWFVDARDIAFSDPGDDMMAFAIGLGADAAVAACMGMNFKQTIRLLAKAVHALSDVEPNVSTRAAYCHSMVRGAVFWALSRIMGHGLDNVDHLDQVFKDSPGLCSKPDPPATAEKIPLCDIDACWYLLSMMEVAAGIDLSIVSSLTNRLRGGTIPWAEWLLRVTALEYAIDRLDPEAFSISFMKYIEIDLYLERGGSKPGIDWMNLERDEIETVDENTQLDDHRAEQVARDAIAAYGIRSVIAEAPDAMSKMKESMSRRFGRRFPNLLRFDDWQAMKVEDEIQNVRLQPYGYLRVGFLLLVVMQSLNLGRGLNLGRVLVNRMANWQRNYWKHIVADRAFMLSQPRRTVPRIQEILSKDLDNEKFLAGILLAASEAIGARLRPKDRDFLEQIQGATRAR